MHFSILAFLPVPIPEYKSLIRTSRPWARVLIEHSATPCNYSLFQIQLTHYNYRPTSLSLAIFIPYETHIITLVPSSPNGSHAKAVAR